MGKRVINIFIPIFCIVLLSSSGESRILDELTLVNSIGFDISESGDKIIGVICNPIFQKDAPPKNNVLSAKAELKKSILQVIQEKSANPIATGSLEILLFGKELTKQKGILDLIDPFTRDPRIGTAMRMAIVDGNVREFMEGNYGVRGNAFFIKWTIDTAVNHGNLPKTNFHRFLVDFHSHGKSPYVPIIKKERENKIKIIGVGFIRFGKLVHQISMEEAFFFKLLTDKYSRGWHDVEIDGYKASIQNINTKRKFELTKSSPPYEVTVKIHLKGVINEYTGIMINNKALGKLETKFEEEIKKRSLELINVFKEKDIDPIGFGRFIKSEDRKFNYQKWRDDYYKNLTVKVDVHVDIDEVGIVE